MPGSHYTAEIDLEDVNSSHTLAVLDVPARSLVLDIGCADGSVARRLVERGSRVIGIEVDAAAAAAASEICERVVVDDIEKIDLPGTLGDAAFDYVLLLDVLEHLRDPVKTLRAAASVLRSGGRMIVSVPNVTHAAVRLALLSGRFQYTGKGLLDRTHLHFFDRAELERTIAEAGLSVLDRMRTVARVTETEIAIDPDAFPPETLELALRGEDSDTYQFVYVLAAAGAPAPEAGPVALGEALQRRAVEAERARAEAEAYVQTLQERVSDLEDDLKTAVAGERETRERSDALCAELRARIAELEEESRVRLAELSEELRMRIGELERLHEDLRYAKLDVAIKDEQLAVLQAELVPRRIRHDRVDDVLAFVRRSIGTRFGPATSRMPLLHRMLKRIADRLTGPRR